MNADRFIQHVGTTRGHTYCLRVGRLWLHFRASHLRHALRMLTVVVGMGVLPRDEGDA